MTFFSTSSALMASNGSFIQLSCHLNQSETVSHKLRNGSKSLTSLPNLSYYNNKHITNSGHMHIKFTTNIQSIQSHLRKINTTGLNNEEFYIYPCLKISKKLFPHQWIGNIELPPFSDLKQRRLIKFCTWIEIIV